MALKETQTPLMAKNNATYKTVEGVTYFKLKSEFEGDYTKHCGLLGEEIDENFYFLRGYDIEDITIDENRNLIITRVDKDYEPIVVNIDEEIGHPSFSFNREQGIITVTYPDGSVTLLDGFPIEGHDIRIAVDSSLVGNGTIFNPLKLSPIEKTGTFAPVEEYIDCTINAGFIDENDVKLPEKERGYRILSKELIDNFGYLYPLSAVKALDEYFKEQQSLWRVTTKEDWDNILNYYECPEHRNHDKTTCEWLGDRAGRAVKSGKYWINYDELPTFGENTSELSVFPLGLVPDRNEILEEQNNDAEGFGKLTGIWTSTCGKDGNAYAKIFSYKSGLVKQDTYGAGAKMSIRLIRDWSIENQHHGVEEILGYPFTTVELCGADGRKYVMTDINFYINDDKALQGVKSDEWKNVSGGDRGLKEVYFINESKGNGEWYKKLMDNGDSVVINSHKGKNYHEWRVVDGVLVDTVDYIVSEFNKDFTIIKDDVDDLYSQLDVTNKNIAVISGTINTFSAATVGHIGRIDTDVRFVSGSVDTFSAATVGHIGRIDADITTVSAITTNEVATIKNNIVSLNKTINILSAATIVDINEVIDNVNMLSGAVETFSAATVSHIGRIDTDVRFVSGSVDTFSAATVDNINRIDTDVRFVSGSVDTERSERISADSILQTQITNNISSIVQVTEGLEPNVREEFVLTNAKGEEIGSHIKIYKDSGIISAKIDWKGADKVELREDGKYKFIFTDEVDQDHEYLYLIYRDENGKLDFIGVDFERFINKEESGEGINITDNKISINIKADEKYLKVTSDGLQTIGVDEAISNAAKVINDTVLNLSAATINEFYKTNAALNTESTRATTEELSLRTLIETEKTRAEGEEASIKASVSAEKTRAEKEEASLNVLLVTETENRTSEDEKIRKDVTSNKVYSKDILISTDATGTTLEIQVDGVTISKTANAQDIYDTNVAVLGSLLKIAKVEPTSSSVKSRYELQDGNGNLIGEPIEMMVESALISVQQGKEGDEISTVTGAYTKHGDGDTTMNFIYRLDNGSYELAQIVVSEYFTDSHFGRGLNNQDGVVSLKEGDGNEYLVIGEDTISVVGVNNAIANAKKEATTYSSEKFAEATGYTDQRYAEAVNHTNTRVNDVTSTINNLSETINTSVDGMNATLNNAVANMNNTLTAAVEGLNETLNNSIGEVNSSILNEITLRENAITQINNNLTAEISKRVEDVTDINSEINNINDKINIINGNGNTVGSIRYTVDNEIQNVIIHDGGPISLRPEDTVHSLMREVLTDSATKFYASPYATDMFYVKGENTVTPVSMNLNQYITALENRIIALEELLSGVNGTLEHMVKDTVKNYLVGTINEIKVVSETNAENVENLRIGFDDNAIFGEMPQNNDLNEIPEEQEGLV